MPRVGALASNGAPKQLVTGAPVGLKTVPPHKMVAVVNERFPRKQPRTLVQAYYQNMTQELRDSIRDQIIDAARKAGLS